MHGYHEQSQDLRKCQQIQHCFSFSFIFFFPFPPLSSGHCTTLFNVSRKISMASFQYDFCEQRLKFFKSLPVFFPYMLYSKRWNAEKVYPDPSLLISTNSFSDKDDIILGNRTSCNPFPKKAFPFMMMFCSFPPIASQMFQHIDAHI